MGASHCHHPKVSEFAGARVGEVMNTRPKTLPVDARVGDVRRLFANTHVIAALLVDGTRFAGLLYREWLPSDASDDVPAMVYARRDVPTVRPDTPLAEALTLLSTGPGRRLVVTDGDQLAGLLCMDETGQVFCRADSA